MPVAIDLHDAAQLPVGSSGSALIGWAVGNRSAEIHVTALIHGTAQFQVAQSPLQLRVKMRKGLCVVPDVCAGAMAAAAIWGTAFPSPQISVFLAQNRGRLQNAQVCRYRIQHIRRQGR